MALQVQPLTPDQLDDFIGIHWAAFEPLEADMIMPMIYPGGLQPDLKLVARNRILADTGNDVPRYCFCIKDPATGEMIAISWWAEVRNPPRTRDDVDAEYARRSAVVEAGMTVEGMNVEMCRAFFKAAWYSECEAVQGRPYMSLRLLATKPGHHRRGAGSLLLTHGLEKADRLDLPVYLDSGISGRMLYERHGFKVTKDFPFDGRHYGGRSEGKHWCMLRPAKSELSRDLNVM